MKYPKIMNTKPLSETNITLELCILEDIVYFSGHFPNQPILPGIVQLDWALHYANEYLCINKEKFRHIQQMKFTQVIPPNTKLFLDIRLESEILSFKYYHKNTVYSLGKLRIKP